MTTLITELPFKVKCHGGGLEWLTEGQYRSESGREFSVIMLCPECNTKWKVTIAMTKVANDAEAARRAAYRSSSRPAYRTFRTS